MINSDDLVKQYQTDASGKPEPYKNYRVRPLGNKYLIFEWKVSIDYVAGTVGAALVVSEDVGAYDKPENHTTTFHDQCDNILGYIHELRNRFPALVSIIPKDDDYHKTRRDALKEYPHLTLCKASQ